MPDPKKLSPLETIKENSNFLRGKIKEHLAEDTTHFAKEDKDLLKTHGTYEQDDRDLRQDFLKQGKEPAYSMMVRSKIPGGKLTWEQYLNHNNLADRYGNKTLRITTRQGFQFHGVLKKNLKAVIRGIHEKLGTTSGACGDVVRNVMACPAPVQDRKRMEIFRYAKAVSDQFLSHSAAYYEIWLNGDKVNSQAQGDIEPIYGKTYLPRKFKIAIAFPDDNCTDIYTNDIGIVPEIETDILKGFNIVVGGGFGMTHGIKETYPRLASPFCFVKPDELLDITKAIVLTQRDFGNRSDRKRARMKYLIDEKGLDWFGGEVEKRFGKKTEKCHLIHWQGIENHLGWHEEGGGRWFLGVCVENGRIKDEGSLRLKSGLRAAIEKYRPDVYLTAQQDILLSGFEEGQKAQVEALLTSYGIVLPDKLSNVQKDSMACPALPTCGLAIAEAERALPSVIDQIEQKTAELGLSAGRIVIRMTGCPNGCARPYNAEIAFVGRTVGTYNVYVGGALTGERLNFLIGEKIAEKDLSGFLTPLLISYKEERQKGEGFGDFCHRLGLQKLRLMVEKSFKS
ncbi:MAG: NADPH-dependent assimilatory sulfite reductase hemoprotein subunit [Candidatus Omnitrophica bacterium]|nr:NADPH-dependent assimilatory sulfite reductase hemoprotein subunit [Candidatus Omnitrophota bacterium]